MSLTDFRTPPPRPRRGFSVWALCLLVVSMAIAPGGARAQESKPEFNTDELEQKARAHYERAMRAFQSGDYETAVDELRTVYSLRPAAILLYNIALAEWRSGDLEAAIIAAIRAREEGLGPRADAKNSGRIRGFRRVRASRKTAEAVAARATTERSPQALTDTSSTADGTAPAHTLRWIGVGVGALGVGAFGGAIYVDRRLSDKIAPYEEAARRGNVDAFYRYRRDELKDAERLQTTGRVLFWSGVAATVAGGTLVALDAASANRASVSVAPLGEGWAASLSIDF